MTTLARKLASGILALALIVTGAGALNFLQTQVANAVTITPIAGETYYLSAGGVTSTATSVTLTTFTFPATTTPITTSHIGTTMYATIEPGNVSRQEIISFTGVTQNADGTATLTGVTRGLLPYHPYTSDSTLKKQHPGGSILSLSNPPQLYFDLIEYTDDAAFAGAPDASAIVKGLGELATGAEIAASTATGGSGPLIIPASLATTTYNANTAANRVPVTDGSGLIDEDFLVTTFANEHTFSATTTFTGNPAGKLQPTTISVVASTTFTGATSPQAAHLATSSPLYVHLADGNDTLKQRFSGFVTTSGSAGASMTLQTSGVVPGFTGLTPGEEYYLSDTAGDISTTPGTDEILAGVAVSATELLIQKGTKFDRGVLSLSTSVSDQVQVIGFKPSRIIIFARKVNDAAGSNEHSFLDVVWSSAGTSVMANASGNGNETNDTSNARLYSGDTTGGNYVTVGIGSVNDLGFTITLAETGTFTGDGTLIWTAEGNI